MAALDTHERCDLALFVNALDIVDAGGKNKIVRIARDDIVADGIDHLESPVGGMVSVDVTGRNIDGEKLSADTTGFEASDVGVTIVGGLSDVVALHRAAGDVVVSVDKERGFMDALDLGVGHIAFLR